MKIVLLGANGQLGTDIRKVFAPSKHYELICVYRKDLDVEKWGGIAKFLQQIGGFDVLINCTAYHKTDACEANPTQTFAVNSIAAAEMAKYCNLHGKVLIHFSTDYVFDGKQSAAYKEADPTDPLNIYGCSKLAGEHLIRAYHDRYFIFRVSSLFGTAGASGKGGNFVESIIRLANEGQTLQVVDDQIMSPTYTLDIARAIKRFIDQHIPDYGIYHCSGEGQCSWYQFAAEICSQLNLQAALTPVATMKNNSKANRPNFSVLDNGKINAVIQMPHWQASLREYLNERGC